MGIEGIPKSIFHSALVLLRRQLYNLNVSESCNECSNVHQVLSKFAIFLFNFHSNESPKTFNIHLVATYLTLVTRTHKTVLFKPLYTPSKSCSTSWKVLPKSRRKNLSPASGMGHLSGFDVIMANLPCFEAAERKALDGDAQFGGARPKMDVCATHTIAYGLWYMCHTIRADAALNGILRTYQTYSWFRTVVVIKRARIP